MTPERFRLIEEVFLWATNLGGAARDSYLGGACGDDEDLRRRVESLLRQHDPTSGFLEPPLVAGGSRAGAGAGVPGKRVGRYLIVRLIATGGMGAVYEAEQEKPSRRVALKVMRAGLGSERARGRFEFEAQVLASLRHPNIAQVYEAGVYEDLGGPAPFFAMELVNGASITAYGASRSMTDRLRLMVQVCTAVQHAHLRGVVHRDLKPSNILVEDPGEGVNERRVGVGMVKVIDFGVARVVSGEAPVPSVGTEAGAVLGTLAYMSPEQCTGSGEGVDARSDVYSLGVVLYEVVCGRLPYEVQGKSIAETASIIATRAAVRPSSLEQRARGDLETILLTALQKDPERRYQSAGELGRDIERFLALEPIEARAPTALYQAWMFARRHRGMVAAATGMVLALIVATAVSVTFALAARREAARAALQEKRSDRRADFLQGALASANPWFPPSFSEEDLSDYEPWDEWQGSPWPYAGLPGRAASVADVVMAAVERVPTEFADDPETRARLSDTLGWTLQRMLSTERHPLQARMLEHAEALLRDALAIRRELKGDTHEDTIRSMMRLAEFLDYTPGGGAEGGDLYEEAWRVCERVYGPHDARTLHALRGWVNNRSFMQGRWEEGRARLEEAVGWAVAPDSAASAPVLITLAYYAYLSAYIGECERSAAMVERSVGGLAGDVGGKDDVRSAFAKQYAAQAMARCGKYEQAERLMRAALAGQRAFFGEKSLEAASRLSALGSILVKQQRWGDAAAVQREAYELLLGIRGPEHPDTLSVQWQLAESLWFGRENLAESERLAMGAYISWVELYSPTDHAALRMAQRLGEGGLLSGQYERTIVFLDEQLRHAASPGVDPVWAGTFSRLRAACVEAMADRTGGARGEAAERMRRVEEVRSGLKEGALPSGGNGWRR